MREDRPGGWRRGRRFGQMRRSARRRGAHRGPGMFHVLLVGGDHTCGRVRAMWWRDCAGVHGDHEFGGAQFDVG